ncbi:MAG: hypothetical protein ACTSUL_01125 [Promethearchaeota archaeon]
MNIWILDSQSGITILYKSYLNLPLDEDLVSGLLAALNQFTIFEFQQGIESIDMGGLRWVYLENKKYNLLFIAAAEKNVNSSILKARLKVILDAFVERYIEDEDIWKNSWKGNTDRFKDFGKVIDEYYEQWLTVEGITTIAEYYNILGIFQQIFNLLTNVIEEHFNPIKKEEIYNQIERMFTKILNQEIINENPELKKISFNRKKGINVINIDPSNCDMILVERQLITLITRIVNLIKLKETPERILKYFIDENIFDYLISNFTLLNQLNLFKFFLLLFLLK